MHTHIPQRTIRYDDVSHAEAIHSRRLFKVLSSFIPRLEPAKILVSNSIHPESSHFPPEVELSSARDFLTAEEKEGVLLPPAWHWGSWGPEQSFLPLPGIIYAGPLTQMQQSAIN